MAPPMSIARSTPPRAGLPASYEKQSRLVWIILRSAVVALDKGGGEGETDDRPDRVRGQAAGRSDNRLAVLVALTLEPMASYFLLSGRPRRVARFFAEGADFRLWMYRD